MIAIAYEVPRNALAAAAQVEAVTAVPLSRDELALFDLEVTSDVTELDEPRGVVRRTLTLAEGEEFLRNFPTDEARRAAVKGLYGATLSLAAGSRVVELEPVFT